MKNKHLPLDLRQVFLAFFSHIIVAKLIHKIMAIEIVTKDDLIQFKNELIKVLEAHFQQNSIEKYSDGTKWLKSNEVERMLKISTTKLQVMRLSGLLPYSKIGNTIFYDLQDVNKVINDHKLKRVIKKR
jgi:hypothetical protein